MYHDDLQQCISLLDEQNPIDSDSGICIGDVIFRTKVMSKERQDRKKLGFRELCRFFQASKIIKIRGRSTWFRKVSKKRIASTCRKGFTIPVAAWRSSKTWSEKNLTTSTRALVEVTPCFPEKIKLAKKIEYIQKEVLYLDG